MTNSQATAYNLRSEPSTIRVGERGRITVPARFRKRLGIKNGDTFSIRTGRFVLDPSAQGTRSKSKVNLQNVWNISRR